MEYAEHEQALSKAKIQLMARPDSVFFTTLCFSLHHRFSDEVPTAATDGREVIFNPGFFMKLNSEERVFLLLHETMHCAYLHMLRRGDREPRLWNIAGDHVINLQLIERGFRMPSGGLADPKYKGLSADEVYDLLPKSAAQQEVMMDLKEPEGGGSQGDAQEMEAEMQDILVRASLQSKMAGDKPGTIPGEIEIFLSKLLNPKLPWNRILQKYLNNMVKNDYSFKKPNRRFFPDHHLPTLYSHALMNIAIAVDTSGSVSNQDFLRFISEIHSILRMMKPEKITLIQFDTAIKSIDEVRDVNELMRVNFKGRGGTDVTPVTQWAEKNKPQLLMVFTDGEFRFKQSNSKIPHIWLIHANPKFAPPFGKVIHYEI